MFDVDAIRAEEMPRRRSARLRGKRVLLTGAGGSIGSALAMAIQASAPAALILLDTSESGLYAVDRELREAGSKEHVPVLGSVCDEAALQHVFEQHRPQIVLHAAALKQVPLMELNPFAAMTNNALGTLTLTETAIRHAAERLVLVSTDKAVAPRSIMGASKRLAELIVLTRGTAATRLVAVRLCNVMGSQGSVLPLLLDQLAHKTALTVTDPDAERYFVTLDYAVACLLAAVEDDSDARLMIPIPGAPLRIVDIAKRLLQADGSTNEIVFTGLRPGDKLSEQLFSEHECALPAVDELALLRAVLTASPSRSFLDPALEEMRAAVCAYDLARLLRAVRTVVPEYEPSSVLEKALMRQEAREPDRAVQV